MAEVGDALGLNGLTHIAVDGKSLRGAAGNTFTGCVHVVAAWATEYGLLLGQEVVADKANEIPAFPELPKALQLKGTLATLDAAGCQTAVADAIRDGGGDYLLAAVEAAFADAAGKEFVGLGGDAPRGHRGRARTARGAVRDGHPDAERGAAGGVAGRGGGGAGDPRADGGRHDGADDDVLHHQPEPVGGGPDPPDPSPLGNRE